MNLESILSEIMKDTYQQEMCHGSNSINWLEIFNFVHCRKQTPGGGAQNYFLSWTLRHHQARMGHWGAVDSKLGNGSLRDSSDGQTTSNCKLNKDRVNLEIWMWLSRQFAVSFA